MKRRAQYWVGSWIELAQALIKILTFNFVVPHWDFDYLGYITIKWWREDENEKTKEPPQGSFS
jgi:hypothetical protein